MTTLKRMNADCIRAKIFDLDKLDADTIHHFKKYGRQLMILDLNNVRLPKDKWLRIRVKDFEVHELGGINDENN